MGSREPEIKVFISYARTDQELRRKLEEHLSALKHSGKISIWQDQEILAGENWDKSIQTRLKDANMILLLVSASLLASNYGWDEEVQKALQRHQVGTATVIPIILRPTDWQRTPLGQLQALPTGGKPITQWNDQDAAFEDVARGIQKVVERIQRETQASTVQKFPESERPIRSGSSQSSAMIPVPRHRPANALTGMQQQFTKGKVIRSSRLALLVLTGMVIVTLVGGLIWFTHHTTPTGTITEFPLPSGSGPWGITTGPDDNLWFAEWSGNEIGRISISGIITEFSLPTSASGPDWITTGPDGNLWFTEHDGNKIGRISTSGAITEFPLPTSASGPDGIVAGPDRNLWFTEADSNKIGRISTSGAITEFPLPTSASGPVRITGGPDNNLWFTEYVGNKIGRISTSGAITEFPLPPSASGPDTITVGPDNNLWFTEAESKRIGRISTSGAITEFPLPASDNKPGDITAGPDDNLWFTEWYDKKIGRISTSGAITEFPLLTSASGSDAIAAEMDGIVVGADGIVAGPDRNLWFTEATSDNIGRITSGK